MKTSDAGLRFVMANEGVVLHVYNDSRGLATVGVGHLIKSGESFTTITKDQALDLLRADIVSAEGAVNSHVTVPLTQNAFDTCVDFTFNCGGGAFASSTILKRINAGDMQGAADAFLMWCHPPEIMGRRRRERALFMTPDEVTPVPLNVDDDSTSVVIGPCIPIEDVQ